MKWINHPVHLSSGEIISIRVLAENNDYWACPVCGCLGDGEPPWLERESIAVVDGVEYRDPPSGSPSWAICPCCKTQYGLDDAPDYNGQKTMAQIWSQLREAWLSNTKRTPEIDEQLKNLTL